MVHSKDELHARLAPFGQQHVLAFCAQLDATGRERLAAQLAQVDCSLLAWPEGNSEAPMTCSDGMQRTMQIPGDGVVIVDAVRYARVFNSEQTTLPPPEEIAVDDLTPEEAAALQAVDEQQTGDLPDKAPVPLLR